MLIFHDIIWQRMLGVPHVVCLLMAFFLQDAHELSWSKKNCFHFPGYLCNLIPRNTEIQAVKSAKKLSTKL